MPDMPPLARVIALPERPTNAQTAAPELAASPRERRLLPHRGRPFDRTERWWVSSPAAQALAAAAAAHGLPVDTAGALLAERGLLVAELADGPDALTELDAQAAAAQAAGELSDASACYLRSLTTARHVAQSAGREDDAAVVRLPARLTDRIRFHGDVELLLDGDLDQARRFDVAAVLTGRTMTDWALGALLAARADA